MTVVYKGKWEMELYFNKTRRIRKKKYIFIRFYLHDSCESCDFLWCTQTRTSQRTCQPYRVPNVSMVYHKFYRTMQVDHQCLEHDYFGMQWDWLLPMMILRMQSTWLKPLWNVWKLEEKFLFENRFFVFPVSFVEFHIYLTAIIRMKAPTMKNWVSSAKYQLQSIH